MKNWGPQEAGRRFSAAMNNPFLGWDNLPPEAALLFPPPRLRWPQPTDGNNGNDGTGNAQHTGLSSIPFLPRPYPFYISEWKPNWSDVQEFLSYLYGVDEGEMADRVEKKGRLEKRTRTQLRNTIRKRIAELRMKHRVLDTDTVITRNQVVPEIARQIIQGLNDGTVNTAALTDEQLLFVRITFQSPSRSEIH